jgi:hypothetical protein
MAIFGIQEVPGRALEHDLRDRSLHDVQGTV